MRPGRRALRGRQVVGRSGAVAIAEIAAVAHLRMEALPHGVEPLLTPPEPIEPGIDTGVFSYATHGPSWRSTRRPA